MDGENLSADPGPTARVVRWLENRPRALVAGATVWALLLVGLADYLIGFERSFLVFYLLPVGLAAWFVGARFAVAASAASVAVWLAGDLAAGVHCSNLSVPGWNALVALLFFLAFAALLARLRATVLELEARVRQRTAALTDEMAERARLENELLAVSEREQRRIGHELHDSLGQHLTGTALASQVLASRLTGREAVDAEHVVGLVEEAIDLTRRLARGLFPVQIEAAGLMAALQELTETTAARHRLECRFECELPVRDGGTAMHLYRIAQEAIANAVRHGGARRVTVELCAHEAALLLTVLDGGAGLPEPLPAAARSNGGMACGSWRTARPSSGAASTRAGPRPLGAPSSLARCRRTRCGTLRPFPSLREAQAIDLMDDIAPKPDKRRVFLVDDHPLVREWLTNLVDAQPDLAVCGGADDAPSALAAIGALQPEAAVVDLTLASGAGLDLIKDMRACASAVAVVVLSMHDETLYAERALRVGARAYVMKRDSTKRVLAAIHRVLEGGVYVSDTFAAQVAARLIPGAGSAEAVRRNPVETLSSRELEVFQQLGQGRTTAQIAGLLSISLKTVQAYCARMKEKLGVGNAVELLREAIRWEERSDRPM